MTRTELEDLLRRLAPQVLGAVVRRYGNFELAEDATQEALLAATLDWQRHGFPQDAKAWLITVASRRLTDLLRADQARRRREDAVAHRPVAVPLVGSPDERSAAESDDTLILLFMCCHPVLSAASQIALTLRAVGGLTTAEIARAFLAAEDTMTRRITRAKQSINDSGIPFAMPSPAERGQRLDVVLRVLYLIFNEGYASTTGPELQRTGLAAEAIRLARIVHAALPEDSEVAGLLALMLLTDARHRARTEPDGTLVPMSDQDRSLWDSEAIAEGVALITGALPRGPTGPYQLQAAIAAIHDEAPTADATDWPQIVALYEVLLRIDHNPVVALNHAVAVAMVRGPGITLDLLAGEADRRVNEDRRFHAVRAHLLEMTGDRRAARESYEAAAVRAMNLQQKRYLHFQAARLTDPSDQKGGN
jgi:RNA polymerase sigma factor (sigma-70 family)